MYLIEWTKKAVKQLSKIQPLSQRQAIADAVKNLEINPVKHNNVKALKNHNKNYRLRIGNYRVLFSIKQRLEIITIEKVAKRDERTY